MTENQKFINAIKEYLGTNPERKQYLIAVIAESFDMDDRDLQAEINKIEAEDLYVQFKASKKEKPKMREPETSDSGCGGSYSSSNSC